MRKLIFISILAIGTLQLGIARAQENNKKKKVEVDTKNGEEVEVEIKNDKDIKLEIKNGEVYIDGKKVDISGDESGGGKNGKIVQKKIIINGKELSDEEMQGFGPGENFLFNFDENDKKPMLGVSTKASENNDGALVENVVPNSPAQKIGLQKGDVITRVNDRNIYNPKDLVDAISSFKPGNEVEITYERDHKFLTKQVVLKGKNDVTTFRGTMPFSEDMFRQFGDGENPFMMSPFNINPAMNGNQPKIGVSVEDRESGQGVLVQDITENSAAQKAGIQKGDIITGFDAKDINNVDDLLAAIADAKSKDKVLVDILRSSVKKSISMNMPKNIKKRDL